MQGYHKAPQQQAYQQQPVQDHRQPQQYQQQAAQQHVQKHVRLTKKFVIYYFIETSNIFDRIVKKS